MPKRIHTDKALKALLRDRFLHSEDRSESLREALQLNPKQFLRKLQGLDPFTVDDFSIIASMFDYSIDMGMLGYSSSHYVDFPQQRTVRNTSLELHVMHWLEVMRISAYKEYFHEYFRRDQTKDDLIQYKMMINTRDIHYLYLCSVPRLAAFSLFQHFKLFWSLHPVDEEKPFMHYVSPESLVLMEKTWKEFATIPTIHLQGSHAFSSLEYTLQKYIEKRSKIDLEECEQLQNDLRTLKENMQIIAESGKKTLLDFPLHGATHKAVHYPSPGASDAIIFYSDMEPYALLNQSVHSFSHTRDPEIIRYLEKLMQRLSSNMD